MKEFFTEMFSAEAKVSSMRWVFVWTWLVCILVPVGSWAYKFCQDGKADLPAGIAMFVGTTLATITAGKGWQSKVESKDGPAK